MDMEQKEMKERIKYKVHIMKTTKYDLMHIQYQLSFPGTKFIILGTNFIPI